MAEGGSSAYAGRTGLPDLVVSALSVADSLGFDNSCAPEQGALLSVLARGWRGGRIGETGTGCGVGLAFMVDATDPSTSLVSVDIDQARATAAAQLFAGLQHVRVMHSDWRVLHEHGPFDLLVLDGGGKGKDPAVDAPLDPAAGWLSPGGTIVLDDFTPAGAVGAPAHDPVRRHWLEHPLLHAVEIRLSSTLATIVGVRVR